MFRGFSQVWNIIFLFYFLLCFGVPKFLRYMWGGIKHSHLLTCMDFLAEFQHQNTAAQLLPTDSTLLPGVWAQRSAFFEIINRTFCLLQMIRRSGHLVWWVGAMLYSSGEVRFWPWCSQAVSGWILPSFVSLRRLRSNAPWCYEDHHLVQFCTAQKSPWFFVIENPFLIYCFKQPFANSGFGSTHGLTSNTITHTHPQNPAVPGFNL